MIFQEAHEPPLIGYPMLFVCANPPELPRRPDPTPGWCSLAGAGLCFASVTADHHSIMRSPAVADLAVLIERALGS
jgi:hypothetical protein